jgi:hypothetical protein
MSDDFVRKVLQIPALGRIFNVGTLYDSLTHTIVQGIHTVNSNVSIKLIISIKARGFGRKTI